MFIVRDFSRENINKQTNSYQTLRSCTSEKRLPVSPTPNEYLRVGSYKYREQDILGKGFSSKVYKAHHINNTEDRYAIKVINLKKFKASNITMLESQIEVHRTLSHPNIVRFHDAYKTENFYYIITQYCPHGDLMELLNQKKKIQQSKSINIIQQIIEAYTYLSKRFIFHRDLKPANIFRSGDTWKIGDFGFSLVCRGESFFDKINVGTPLYMPLESLKTNKYSFKSDIFAIGIILYEIVTGRTPWQCKTEKELINKMKSENIKFSHIQNETIKNFVERACSRDEAERLGIDELSAFFNAKTVANPEQKENQPKTLRNVMSMKHFREQSKISIVSPSKNTNTSIRTTQKISLPSKACQSSTEVSEQSDSIRAKPQQSYKSKNTRLILQQLQYCRLIYYMTKNIKHFLIEDPQAKGFFNLTLFKHLLRCIKQLQQPNQNFPDQLISFQIYQHDKEYKTLMEEIKSYSKRYEKEYLDVLKNTQISIIRSVNRKFPELSYNSSLGEKFHKNFHMFFIQILRSLNHGICVNQNIETDPRCLSCSYQTAESLLSFCRILEHKVTAYEVKKVPVFSKMSLKVVMDYRQSKLEKKDYQNMRNQIRDM